MTSPNLVPTEEEDLGLESETTDSARTARDSARTAVDVRRLPVIKESELVSIIVMLLLRRSLRAVDTSTPTLFPELPTADAAPLPLRHRTNAQAPHNNTPRAPLTAPPMIAAWFDVLPALADVKDVY